MTRYGRGDIVRTRHERALANLELASGCATGTHTHVHTYSDTHEYQGRTPVCRNTGVLGHESV